MIMKKITIAIDGYSSSGKSTMARRMAADIGYKYIDSGAMYRAVTLYAIRHSMLSADDIVQALPDIDIDFLPVPGQGQHTLLNGEDVESEIRSMNVAARVSGIAAIPEVRRALTARMREFGVGKGIVMDGRDIGTTVFPDAEMKVFVDASPEVRAMRRFKELQQKGQPADYAEVLANVEERDRIDSTRAESPLRKADDAHVLCNDHMTPDQQHEWMVSLYKSLLS